MASQADREALFARLRALAAKTVENGCTEAEAIAAAAKLAALLEQHNVTLDEAELRASPFSQHEERHADEVGARLWKVARGISVLTDTRWWISGPGVHPIEIGFFGFDHEVVVARYLLEICAGAMRRAELALQRQYALLRPAAQRRRIMPFLDGMADRLGDRIAAMKPPAPTGTGLVVLRGELINAAAAEIGLEIISRKVLGSRATEDTYCQGRRAADGVALNRGVAGSAATARLGGRA
jgi:hypothetical protein